MKSLTLRIGYLMSNQTTGIVGIGEWLNKQMLHGKKSRMRTRFVKILQERGIEIEKEIKRIKEDNAEKKDDKALMIDKEGKDTLDPKEAVAYKIEDQKKFQEEIVEYMKEEFVIDITPANNEAVYLARNLILSTEEKFGGGMAEMYDDWCESFEEIKEEE